MWTNNDWLVNLQEMADKDTAFDVGDLLPAMKGVLSKDGDLYAMPFYGESAFTMYRKDLFDKHGLKMPEEPTWDDIKSLAATIKEKESGITPLVLRGLPGWGENMAVVGSMMQSFGAQWFDIDWNPMMTSDNTKRCFEYYVDVQKQFGQTGAAQAGFTECLNIMSQGKGAIWFDATSAANSLESPASSTVVGQMGYADALHNGRLHGAGLDVTEPEPLPAESPLWDEPHCLITPHVAGGNHLEKTSEHIIRIALTNVSRYAKQQELLNLVRY